MGLILLYGGNCLWGQFPSENISESDAFSADKDPAGFSVGYDYGFKIGWEGARLLLPPPLDNGVTTAKTMSYWKEFNAGYQKGWPRGSELAIQAHQTGYRDGSNNRPCQPSMPDDFIGEYWKKYEEKYFIGWQQGYKQYLANLHKNSPSESKEFQAGFDKGFEDATKKISFSPQNFRSNDFTNGYQTGYSEGKNLSENYDVGYRDGHKEGYDDGLADLTRNNGDFDRLPPSKRIYWAAYREGYDHGQKLAKTHQAPASKISDHEKGYYLGYFSGSIGSSIRSSSARNIIDKHSFETGLAIGWTKGFEEFFLRSPSTAITNENAYWLGYSEGVLGKSKRDVDAFLNSVPIDNASHAFKHYYELGWSRALGNRS